MGQFSEDCQWWWDGQKWIPTSQVVVPQLPPTDIEKSGHLAEARADFSRARRSFWLSGLLTEPFGLSPVNRGGLSTYWTWTMEQLALSTAYLLGPDESMLAGEMSRHDLWDGWTRNLAIAVTSGHVIVFRIDHRDGQPRWVAMAARPSAVRMERRSLLFGAMYQALEVFGPNGRWSIQGFKGEKQFNPEPVIDAWRQAAHATAGA